MKAADFPPDPPPSGGSRPSAAIEREASRWLALRAQRELTGAELSAYATWLAADPRHGAAVAELDSAWRTFDRLCEYPHPDGPADPDFFARPRRFRRQLPLVLAAAAVVALAVAVWHRVWPSAPSAVEAPRLVQADTSRFVELPDGSQVELKAGSEISERFVPAERRVLLIRGEAHFIVAKNPARPFIVEADGVAVRAVGTVFNVRMDAASVEVLVTEGKVQVNPPASPASSLAVPATLLVAGQRTIVATGGGGAAEAPAVLAVSPREVDRLLAWQSSRLVFEGTPLAEVVARFNRRLADGRKLRLVLVDHDLGAMRISGRFEANNVETFVELLETSFGVDAHQQGAEIILRKAP